MLAQQVVNGLLLGGIYALVALAFSLTIGILNFLNFSIPALFMLGGIVSCAMLAKGYSIACLVLFENLVVIYFGSEAVGYPSPFGGASIRIVSVLISLPQLASFAI